MAVTDKVYLKNRRQLAAALDANLPRGAFSGGALDQLYRSPKLDALDDATRDRVEDFATDFLDCDCESNPFCGHPERKFLRYLLELRAQGLGPDAIVDRMGEDYMVYAYPGDVLSFLDDAVRTLDAMESLAAVDGNEDAGRAARERRDELL